MTRIRKTTGSKICECGAIKDYRAKRCAKCAGVSVPMKENGVTMYNDELLKKYIVESKSILEVANKSGHCRSSIKKYIENNNIDISHFRGCSKREYSLKTLFTICDNRINNTIISYGLKYNLLENKCYTCGLTNTWQGQPITLELHHMNGNPLDNNIENLQMLCPNCHSQTNTNKGKNSKKKKNETIE